MINKYLQDSLSKNWVDMKHNNDVQHMFVDRLKSYPYFKDDAKFDMIMTIPHGLSYFKRNFGVTNKNLVTDNLSSRVFANHLVLEEVDIPACESTLEKLNNSNSVKELIAVFNDDDFKLLNRFVLDSSDFYVYGLKDISRIIKNIEKGIPSKLETLPGESDIIRSLYIDNSFTNNKFISDHNLYNDFQNIIHNKDYTPVSAKTYKLLKAVAEKYNSTLHSLLDQGSISNPDIDKIYQILEHPSQKDSIASILFDKNTTTDEKIISLYDKVCFSNFKSTMIEYIELSMSMPTMDFYRDTHKVFLDSLFEKIELEFPEILMDKAHSIRTTYKETQEYVNKDNSPYKNNNYLENKFKDYLDGSLVHKSKFITTNRNNLQGANRYVREPKETDHMYVSNGIELLDYVTSERIIAANGNKFEPKISFISTISLSSSNLDIFEDYLEQQNKNGYLVVLPFSQFTSRSDFKEHFKEKYKDDERILMVDHGDFEKNFQSMFDFVATNSEMSAEDKNLFLKTGISLVGKYFENEYVALKATQTEYAKQKSKVELKNQLK
jgi:hypothetical protein